MINGNCSALFRYQGALWKTKNGKSIEKCVPHCFTGAYLSLTGTVVGDKEPDLRVRYQVQVAVKILRVAAVPDNAVTIARFFIKSESHRIHAGQVFELARMHQSGR